MSEVFIGQRNVEDVVLILDLDLFAVFRGLSGDRICACSRVRFGSGARFHHLLDIQHILQMKESP